LTIATGYTATVKLQ